MKNEIIKLDNDKIAEALLLKGGMEAVVEQVKAEVAKSPADISTEKGRKATASVAMKIAKTKTSIDKFGLQMGKEIMENRKHCVAELDALKDEYRKPLTEWENIRKIAENRIKELNNLYEQTHLDTPSEKIKHLMDLAKGFVTEDLPEDMHEDAIHTQSVVLAGLEDRLEAALKREADAAELEALRKEKAEKEAVEAVTESVSGTVTNVIEAPEKPVESKAEGMPIVDQAPDGAVREGAFPQSMLHQKEALEDLIKLKVDLVEANRILAAISFGRVRHVSIS